MVKLVEGMNPEIAEPESLVSLSVYDEDATDFSNQDSIQDSVDYLPKTNLKDSPRLPTADKNPPEVQEDSEGSEVDEER